MRFILEVIDQIILQSVQIVQINSYIPSNKINGISFLTLFFHEKHGIDSGSSIKKH